MILFVLCPLLHAVTVGMSTEGRSVVFSDACREMGALNTSFTFVSSPCACIFLKNSGSHIVVACRRLQALHSMLALQRFARCPRLVQRKHLPFDVSMAFFSLRSIFALQSGVSCAFD